MAKYIEEQPNSHNTIIHGTEIVGDINSNGDIRLDGSLKGNLYVRGKVVIGQTGVVDGVINCKNSDIFGKVDGQITVSELLAFKSTANVKGDIITNKLSIEPGCKFSGTCSMDASSANVREKEAEETPGVKTA
ncbi:MAG: polymer-forming cytoskeletal protein [Bacteroidales bacterium]|jgi:cytoskeletal protein CcmA (bactofilin family)|nr:polymer-forming cytoskeletal protein [Bacteroidales bacterium]